jgi:hypothetical protein
MQPRVLVIGAKSHDRADCVDWLQPFPNIEEYDSVIINLQSLTQETYDKIQTKISEMKDPINTIFNTNREIFCIMNKLMVPSPPSHPPGTPFFKPIRLGNVSTNFDWLPTRIEASPQKTGSSMFIHDHRFEKYFQFIDQWNFEINLSPQTLSEFLVNLTYSIYPIAVNKSQKIIAGSIKRTSLNGKILVGKERSAIHLLPPPTRASTFQAIELVLDLIFGEERKIVPLWRKDIEVPKERELETQIEDKIKDIKKIQEEISQLQKQVQKWDSYRDLFVTTGDELENVVQKTLADIGIKTDKTNKGLPVDLISKKFAFEVTGIRNCVGVSSEKVNQTARFKESYHKGEKIVLIANTYMDLPPSDRKGKLAFSPEVEIYFRSLSVCCLTTMTLFQLWKDVMSDKKKSKDVIEKILTKNGELTFNDF